MTSLRNRKTAITRQLLGRRMHAALEDRHWDGVPPIGREFGAPISNAGWTKIAATVPATSIPHLAADSSKKFRSPTMRLCNVSLPRVEPDDYNKALVSVGG
jgi:predicted aminopeptidase